MSARLPTIDFTGLLSQVQGHREKHAALADKLERSSTALVEAVQIVSKSSTGSWFGWHADMYYGDFEEPPLGNLFSVEWGAYHGLPDGWRQRRKQEVEKKTEALAGASFKWDDTAYHGFVSLRQKAAPTMTRDSQAVAQGCKVPAHVHCEAVAYSALGKAKHATEFWTIGARLVKQLQAQASSTVVEGSSSTNALGAVLNLCTRFHLVAKQLEFRHEDRSSITIEDEYDVQDLLYALLRLHFLDVRPEEVAPSFAGRSARMDFLLKNEKIVVETKMTRTNLRDKEIGDELLQDVVRYKNHPDCSLLVCLIYDPHGLIKNPGGLVSDLEKLSDDSLTVRAAVSPALS